MYRAASLSGVVRRCAISHLSRSISFTQVSRMSRLMEGGSTLFVIVEKDLNFKGGGSCSSQIGGDSCGRAGDNFDVAACCAIRWIGLPAWIPHQFRSLALKNGLEIKMPPSATNHVGVGCRVAAVNNIGQMSRPLLRHCHHPSS